MRGAAFAADLRACLALQDAQAAENAAARDRALANPELAALLLADANRRGLAEVDWTEYFRNARINYP